MHWHASRDQLLRKTETRAVNGKQHSGKRETAQQQPAALLVYNSQYHVLVQGGALTSVAPAPATGAGLLGPATYPPLSLPAFPLWAPGTEEMRITPVIEGVVIPQVTGVVRRSRSGPAPRGRACAHQIGTGAGGGGARGSASHCRKRPGSGSTVLRVPWQERASSMGARGDVSCDTFSSTRRLCNAVHISDPERNFSHPGWRCLWRQPAAAFPSPFPSVTPLYSVATRSSGGELRGAPSSVNPRS
jgi:hypothetical protein